MVLDTVYDVNVIKRSISAVVWLNKSKRWPAGWTFELLLSQILYYITQYYIILCFCFPRLCANRYTHASPMISYIRIKHNRWYELRSFFFVSCTAIILCQYFNSEKRKTGYFQKKKKLWRHHGKVIDCTVIFFQILPLVAYAQIFSLKGGTTIWIPHMNWISLSLSVYRLYIVIFAIQMEFSWQKLYLLIELSIIFKVLQITFRFMQTATVSSQKCVCVFFLSSAIEVLLGHVVTLFVRISGCYCGHFRCRLCNKQLTNFRKFKSIENHWIESKCDYYKED